ncbi:MAG: UDP-N-acetylmuramoyl-L-alanyl-D-glutamate--2,6-diaminopimelate ligase [Candidatus Dormibacteria bacterium]
MLRAAGVPPAGGANLDGDVSAIEYDSRACGPGSVFVAIRGFHVDGHAFIDDAVQRGAIAVVAEHAPARAPGAALVVVPDTRVALSALAAAFYARPSDSLTVAGVTGTDGKTTTCTMLWSAWRAAGINAGSLTTVDWRRGDEVTANTSRQTTLEARDLQEHLAAMRDAHCTHVALETSSHALALHRVDDVRYRCAVYTRITSEHLDVHGTREAYLAAKARLADIVARHRDGVAVLDATDDFAFPVLSGIPVATRLTYSIDPRVAADVQAHQVAAAPDGLHFRAQTPWGSEEVSLRLAGRFNVANACAALTAACVTGASLRDAARGLAAVDRVPGRMELVDAGQPFAVVVDYAHTADALETVLRELRPTTRGRLWAVFGSAGERDRDKRPEMGAVAARFADRSVITDEDPRGEDRLRILEEIAGGATAAGGARGETVVIIPDRSEAIAYAMERAAPGDTVLLAGKGHESSIITASGPVPWNERAVAEAALAALSR